MGQSQTVWLSVSKCNQAPLPPGKFALAWDGTGTGQSITGCEVHYRLARGQINYPTSVESLSGKQNTFTRASYEGHKEVPSKGVKGIWDKNDQLMFKSNSRTLWHNFRCLSLLAAPVRNQAAGLWCLYQQWTVLLVHSLSCLRATVPRVSMCSRSTTTSLLTQMAKRVSHKDFSARFDVWWGGFWREVWLRQTFSRETCSYITRHEVELDYLLLKIKVLVLCPYPFDDTQEQVVSVTLGYLKIWLKK